MRDKREHRVLVSKLTGAAIGVLLIVVVLLVWLAPIRNAGAQNDNAPAPTVTPTPILSSNLNLMMTIPPWPASMTMTEGAMHMVMLHLTGIQPTWAEISRVYSMLSATKAAVDKYQDVRVAVRDGYFTAGWLDVSTQGLHYVKPQNVPSRMKPFDPTMPMALVYNRENGALKLSGVLFAMPADSTPAELAAVFPPSLASWHQHVNLCFQPDRALPYYDSATCRAHQGQYVGRTEWIVHAWLWAAGATPVFAMDRT